MTTFLSHFTLHLPWCPVKFQILQQKIGEKNPLHFAVSLLDNFLNSEFWLFSILSGRQLDHPSHTDSLSERGPCQKHRAGTPFEIGLLALFEVMQFAFKCNQHGNPQETPPHILVTNMQHSNILQFRRKEEKKTSDFAVTFFFFPLWWWVLCSAFPDCRVQRPCVLHSVWKLPWSLALLQLPGRATKNRTGKTRGAPSPALNPQSCRVPATTTPGRPPRGITRQMK